MKILELILENFEGVYIAMHTNFVRLDLRESKHKICLITGPNGKGKTVLLSQLNPFSSLGTLDERDSLPLIRKDKNGHKKIVIFDRGNEYEIDHFYTPSKTSHTVKSYIKKNGEELNPNGNVTSFKEVVKVELDIEPDYMKLIRLGNNVVNLIDLKNAERKTFMSKRLEEVNVFLLYYKKINTELNTLKTLNAMVIDKLKKTNIESEEDFILAKEALVEKQKELEEIEADILAITDSISKTKYQLSEIPEDTKQKMKDAERKLEKLLKKSGNEFESLESLEKRYKAISENIIRNKERHKSLCNSVNVYIETIDRNRTESENTKAKIDHIVNESDLDGLMGLIESLKIRIKNDEGKYKKYGEIKYTKKDVEDVLSFFKEKQEVLSTTYEFGDEPIKKVISIMKKGESVSTYINEHLKKAIEEEEIKSGKALIRRLLSMYNEKPACNKNCSLLALRSSLESISGINDSETKYNKEFFSYMNLAYTAIKAVMLSFSEKKNLFELMPDNIKEFSKIESLYDRIRACEWIYDREVFFEELAFMTEYENHLKDIETLEDKEKELKLLLKSSPLPVLESLYSDLKKNMKEYSEKIVDTNNEIRVISGVIKSDEVTLEELEILIEIIKQKDTIESIYYENKALLEKQANLLRQLQTEESMFANASFERKRLQQWIATNDHNLKQAKVYQKELKVYQKFFDDWSVLKESLSSNKGIPLIFIDLYLKKAKAIVNSLLDEIYGGNMYIDDFIISADSFNIPFIKDGKSISDIRYASQGEKSFFSIALSFAISFQSMSRYNIMLLDELDSVLDESNRSKFIAILEKLEDMIDSEQMFVISHNNMFSMYPVDVVSVINEINKDNKLSNYIELKYT